MSRTRRHIEQNPKNREAIFMLGAPASGKSTVARIRYPNAFFIDPDEYKKLHPLYDPKDPSKVHQWSAKKAQSAFSDALANRDSPLVVDGTGTNSERLVYQMNKARSEGYRIILLFVVASLKTCLKRNHKRERSVSDTLVISKYETVGTSFQLVAPYADDVIVIRTD